jgi:hypothetical protein
MPLKVKNKSAAKPMMQQSRGERRCEPGKSLDPESRNAQPSKIAKAGATASWC